MSNNFLKAIEFTLLWEVGKDRNGKLRQDGGYTNDPRDPGGETKWGHSKRAHPDIDIPNMTLDKAIALYKEDYYDVYKTKSTPLDLDVCRPSYAVAMFDTGVNCGVNRAYKWHLVASKTKDPTKSLLGLRDAHYTNIKAGNPTLANVYYKGWINRLNDLKKFCEILKDEASAPS